MTDLRMSWEQALGWRLGRQLLDPVGEESPAKVVRRLGAVLSMDESLAELAIRTRRATSSPGELTRALAAGTVIKAYAFRGAVHYLSPADAGNYLAVRAAGRQWELPSWVDHYGLSAQDWPDFRAAVRAALTDGPCTVDELGAVLTAQRAYRHLAPVFAEGPWTLLKALTWQGDMSIGPSREGQPTFQRLDTNTHWVGMPDLEDAGPAVIMDYLRTYGPATVDHVQRWFGEGLSAGRKRLDRWMAGLDDRIVPLDVDGTTAYAAGEDVDDLLAAQPSDVVRFLPGHDQWIMGPGTKDTHVTPAARRDLMTRKANPIIVGGVVRGTWVVRGDELSATWLDPARRPTAKLEQEAQRTARILGKTARI